MKIIKEEDLDYMVARIFCPLESLIFLLNENELFENVIEVVKPLLYDAMEEVKTKMIEIAESD